jgi:hypothetical protein
MRDKRRTTVITMTSTTANDIIRVCEIPCRNVRKTWTPPLIAAAEAASQRMKAGPAPAGLTPFPAARDALSAR